MPIIKTTSRGAFLLPDPKYIELDGDVATVYTGENIPIPKYPVISISADKAMIMLRQAGILDAVQATCVAIGPEASIGFNHAPEWYSDNALVRYIMKSPPFSKTDAEIYQLFINAANYKY